MKATVAVGCRTTDPDKFRLSFQSLPAVSGGHRGRSAPGVLRACLAPNVTGGCLRPLRALIRGSCKRGTDPCGDGLDTSGSDHPVTSGGDGPVTIEDLE